MPGLCRRTQRGDPQWSAGGRVLRRASAQYSGSLLARNIATAMPTTHLWSGELRTQPLSTGEPSNLATAFLAAAVPAVLGRPGADDANLAK